MGGKDEEKERSRKRSHAQSIVTKKRELFLQKVVFQFLFSLSFHFCIITFPNIISAFSKASLRT